jgi:hypothetical protein
MKLTDKGPRTLARQLFLTTMTLVLLAAGSAQAAQTAQFAKNPTLARCRCPQGVAGGLGEALAAGEHQDKTTENASAVSTHGELTIR